STTTTCAPTTNESSPSRATSSRGCSDSARAATSRSTRWRNRHSRHGSRSTVTIVHPAERVRFAIETAKAVLDERLSPAEGARAVRMQAEQVTPLLRSDRDSVTRSESESVATQLRLLAEQVNDRASGLA